VLVLTRRAGESIVIGDDVRVVVLDVRGDTVRLGIDAPRSVQVHRAEVYAEVQAANAAAAHPADDLESVADRLQRMARPDGRRPGRAARTPHPSTSITSTEVTPPTGTPEPPPSPAPVPASAPVPTPAPATPDSVPSAPVPSAPVPRPKPGPPPSHRS